MSFADEFADIFDDEGALAEPTMRGEANLDVQDYQGHGGFSPMLMDGLQEDVPSRPGAGAGPATDIDGTSSFDFLEVPGGMEAPGMKQTTYGSSPWGPGGGGGYRPFSQQRTDMNLRALGDAEEHNLKAHRARQQAKPMQQVDEMHNEPEVIDAVARGESLPWADQNHGNVNSRPSNAEIDPMTIYDRESFEYDNSSQNVIGTGIFDMEEGATFRPRDGIFANQYAQPAYLAAEDELGVQQSEMWDSTAGNGRVTQPSASGVPLATKVPRLKTPFRPEVTGPRSHIEAFGRRAAGALLAEAKSYPSEQRSEFLTAALEALGPGTALKARRTADMLVRLGYPQQTAFEDTVAHLVMHASVKDLLQRAKTGKQALPRLDRMCKSLRRQHNTLRHAATEHLQPLTKSTDSLRTDLGALYASPAARAMGEAAQEDVTAPDASPSEPGMFRPRNLAIAGALGVGAYLLFANREIIVKNVKKWSK